MKEVTKPAEAPKAGEAPAAVAVEKKVEKTEPKTSQSLLMLAMVIEGIVFGSLQGWAVLRGEGVPLAETKKYLGVASVLGPLLVLDRDCCKERPSKWDLGLFALHFALSFRTLFERKLESFGPWSGSSATAQADNLFATVAFWTHFRCWLHLLTREAKGSLAKKLALVVSFAFGSNLAVA